MIFKEFKYLYPPRPKNPITWDELKSIENRGNYIAQYKKNGTCALIYCSPEGEILHYSRHKEKHKAWTPPTHIDDFFRGIACNKKWYVFVAELLHSKGGGFRDVLYLHDILVHADEYLVGTTYENRFKILKSIFPEEKVEAQSHFVITENIWIAKNFSSNFETLYKGIKDPKVDEGLVLKALDLPLQFCIQEDSNSGAQLKCRYSTKNYGF
jgi:hypothetical protein